MRTTADQSGGYVQSDIAALARNQFEQAAYDVLAIWRESGWDRVRLRRALDALDAAEEASRIAQTGRGLVIGGDPETTPILTGDRYGDDRYDIKLGARSGRPTEPPGTAR